MGYWIELMCDINGPGFDESGCHHGCVTSAGNSPGMRVHTKSEVAAAIKIMRRSAMAQGWKRTARGMACPFCAKRI